MLGRSIKAQLQGTGLRRAQLDLLETGFKQVDEEDGPVAPSTSSYSTYMKPKVSITSNKTTEVPLVGAIAENDLSFQLS